MKKAAHTLARHLCDGPAGWVAVAVFASLYLALYLFLPPNLPIWRGGDQTIQLLNATRMRDGEVIFRDFFHFLLPGVELLYLALFAVFGTAAWIPNVILMLLGVSLACLSIRISRPLMRGWDVFLPGALFLPLAFVNALNLSHHWFSALATAGVLAVVIEKRDSTRLAAAAALCGIAAWFTPSRGLMAIVALAIFDYWQSRRKKQWQAQLRRQALLWSGFMLPVAAMSGYFAWKAGMGRFLACVVEFPLRYYSSLTFATDLGAYMIALPPVEKATDLVRLGVYLFLHALIPLIYIVFLMVYRRRAEREPSLPWDRLMLINIMGFFQFAAVASSPSFFRLAAVSLPAFILFSWLVSRPGPRRVFLRGVIWVVVLALVTIRPYRNQQTWRADLALPTGRVAVVDKVWAEKLQWLTQHTRPGDFFFEAIYPDVYYSLGLRDPAPVPFVTATDYTRPAQVREAIEGLERHRVRYVLWSVRLDLVDNAHLSGDHLPPLRAYLRTHYHLVQTFGDASQVWERNQPPEEPPARKDWLPLRK